MARPLKTRYNSTTNDVEGHQEMVDSEIDVIADIILDDFADNVGVGSLAMNTQSTWTGIGTFIDTRRDEPVGTHPQNTIIHSDNYIFRQNLNSVSLSPSTRPVKLHFNSSNVCDGLQDMTDSEIIADIIASVKTKLISFAPGTYKLDVSTPSVPAGATWTSVATITNKSVDGNNSTTLWKRSSASNTITDRPVSRGTTSGHLEMMTDTEIKELTDYLRYEIVNSGIGKYQLSTTAPTGDTWIQAGAGFSDTRQQVSDIGYAGSRDNTYSSTYSGTYTTTYVGTTTDCYSGSRLHYFSGSRTYFRSPPPTNEGYAGSYTGYYAGSRTYSSTCGAPTNGGYTGNYTGSYGSTYAGTFSGCYSGSRSFSGSYTGYYTGSYSAGYSRSFTGYYNGYFIGYSQQCYTGYYSAGPPPSYVGYYCRSFTGSYSRAFSGSYTGYFSGSRNHTYTGYYSGSRSYSSTCGAPTNGGYTGSRTFYYSGSRDHTYAGCYSGSRTYFRSPPPTGEGYAGTYTGYYAGSRTYSSTSYTNGTSYSSNYCTTTYSTSVGYYTGVYSGSYTGTYSSTYVGSTILATEDTISTLKLWLRTT